MIIRALDASGDWTFGKGRNDYLSGNAAIGLSVSTRLYSFLGDCFFAVNAGIDWFNLLGSKNRVALELAVRSTILNTDGITGIVSLSTNLDPSTRNISMTYVLSSVYTNNNPNSLIAATTGFILTESGDVLTTEDGGGLLGG